eukprot:CAMPEP_0172535698 /NCGR_PEP_ID=MMETSP1067-20121228/7585_1 /TAXON_ID=265564 ORGANISM="Thalassiosira punctigera, Strain Tpunct2005C2" /NCGR_SAMPLE_ID=MMETSP1067 /ASSEMBLY_ACC=CAM_ASM_000444 /LENGTH=154 /DNA_ID=CAMNT_0013320639 /DNA_START=25 /DNA_END=489 /DNA_ORIENTATION=+
MKRFSVATAFALASLTDSINAFSPAAPPAGSSRPSSRLRSAVDDEGRIKKAGAGITTQAPGDLRFFDPNESGKLSGTNDLAERVEKGASFALSAGAREGASPPPVPDAPAPPAPLPTATPEAEVKTKNSLTTNLRDLLNGQSNSKFRGWGRSQL